MSAGATVAQALEEPHHRFGLAFDIVTKHGLDGLNAINVFESKPLPIARVDHLTRRQGPLRPSLDDIVRRCTRIGVLAGLDSRPVFRRNWSTVHLV